MTIVQKLDDQALVRYQQLVSWSWPAGCISHKAQLSFYPWSNGITEIRFSRFYRIQNINKCWKTVRNGERYGNGAVTKLKKWNRSHIFDTTILKITLAFKIYWMVFFGSAWYIRIYRALCKMQVLSGLVFRLTL